MNKIVYKISSGIAAASLFALSMAPSAFASSIIISGNGAFSDNDVHVRNTNSTRITQSNNSRISNNVSVRQNTGGNNASFNTGGDTTINTGNASSDVSIVNKAGVNIAHVDGCGCRENSHDIEISGNGAFSDNTVHVRDSNRFTVRQNNNSTIRNFVRVRQNTGHNDSSFNTDGDTVIWTGDSWSRVRIVNKSGLNVLH